MRKVCIQLLHAKSGDYTAVCPSLPGCLSRGHTCQEALAGCEEAIRGYLAAVGDFVPERIEHEIVEPGSLPSSPQPTGEA
jgi:predicted RNase H-like HicB family nuclease